MLNIKQEDNTLYTYLHRFYEVVPETVFNWGQQTVTSVYIFCLFSYKTSMILHIPNTSDCTTLYHVETDIDFTTAWSLNSIISNDVTNYPIMIEPLARGEYSYWSYCLLS